MASYRIVAWRGIPSLVEAEDGEGVVRRPLSQRFQDLIDAVAMRQGVHDSDAYLDGWAAGEGGERPGGAREVAEAVAGEIEGAFATFVAAHLS